MTREKVDTTIASFWECKSRFEKARDEHRAARLKFEEVECEFERLANEMVVAEQAYREAVRDASMELA